jgi:hypothetical protein
MNDNQESNKKSIRGTPIDDDSTEHQKNTNNRPVITKDGISDSDYDKLFLDDIAYCLPIQNGEPLEDEDVKDLNCGANPKMARSRLKNR